jgi:pyruvate dehydrogenase E2 component (dihydrolipoyllysine-residue acetyltransferase)
LTTLMEVRVPDLGDYKDVEVIDIAVSPGDAVALEDALITLETEKATMDVPSTAAGIVRELKVQRGALVSEGDLIAIIEGAAHPAGESPPAVTGEEVPSASGEAPTKGGSAPKSVPLPVSGPGRQAVEASVESPRPVVDEPGFSRAHASPSVRRFARELGVDLSRVRGSGTKGRIVTSDVKAYVKGLLTEPATMEWPAVPRVDFESFGPVERKPLTRIQKISGPRLHASWVNIPHVTQFDEADITEQEATRARLKDDAASRGVKLTPLAFIMRACARALQEFPQFASSLDVAAGELVFKKYIHIGFAADTPNGLVVPVVRDADRKDVYEIAKELAELSERARAGKLAGAEMRGGCFTVSSLGGIGGTAFTPIINAPEVAILGVSRATQKPVLQNGAFVPRLMLPLSLSYDHRVIDGADAARFTTRLGALLGDVSDLLQAIP